MKTHRSKRVKSGRWSLPPLQPFRINVPCGYFATLPIYDAYRLSLCCRRLCRGHQCKSAVGKTDDILNPPQGLNHYKHRPAESVAGSAIFHTDRRTWQQASTYKHSSSSTLLFIHLFVPVILLLQRCLEVPKLGRNFKDASFWGCKQRKGGKMGLLETLDILSIFFFQL